MSGRAVVLCVAICFVLAGSVSASDNAVADALEKLYGLKNAPAVKKHLTLARELSLKGLNSSLRDELKVLSSIDPSSSKDYDSLASMISTPVMKQDGPAATGPGTQQAEGISISRPAADGTSKSNLIQETKVDFYYMPTKKAGT